MRHVTKELKNRTRNGRLNFSITKQGHFLGDRKTANSVAEILEKVPKNWSTIQFRNDDGQRVCVTRDYMDEAGWTADETIKDWLENVDPSELEEPITAMGPEFGVTLEW